MNIAVAGLRVPDEPARRTARKGKQTSPSGNSSRVQQHIPLRKHHHMWDLSIVLPREYYSREARKESAKKLPSLPRSDARQRVKILSKVSNKVLDRVERAQIDRGSAERTKSVAEEGAEVGTYVTNAPIWKTEALSALNWQTP